MTAALTFSRRKMFSKVRVTEVVPAPDEPVMAMMGWRWDMAGHETMNRSDAESLQSRNRLRSANSGLPGSVAVAGSWW
jgi:hypothetical protein